MSFSALRLGVFNRHKPRVVTRGGTRSADVGGQLVECQALGAGNPLHMGRGTGLGDAPSRFRWREEKQLPCCTGVKIAAWRLVARREAIRFQRDEGKPGVECGAGDLLFARADAGRHEDGPAFGGVEKPRLFGGQRVGRNSARALDLQAVGAVEQEGVAVGGVGATCNRQGVEAREVVGVCAAYGQAARVVADVAKKVFQLASVGENAVVVTGGEERGRSRRPVGRRTRRVVRCRAINGAISLGAPDLEAAHHHAQMVRHGAAHKQQPMEMIGHYGTFQWLHVGVKARNLSPAVGDGFAERCGDDSFAYELPQQRTAAFHFKRKHVNASARIVVAETAAFHGVNDWLFHTQGIIEHCLADGKLEAKNVASFFKGKKR